MKKNKPVCEKSDMISHSVYFHEILKPVDPRERSNMFKAAKRKKEIFFKKEPYLKR